jgi:hypothetical protein
MQQPLPDELIDSLADRINSALEGMIIMFAGPPDLLRSAHAAQQFLDMLLNKRKWPKNATGMPGNAARCEYNFF